MDDNIRKAIMFIFLVIGIGIFYTILMTKLEVMAEETNARVQKSAADIAWGDFLYQKATEARIKSRETQAEDPDTVLNAVINESE